MLVAGKGLREGRKSERVTVHGDAGEGRGREGGEEVMVS